MKFITAQDITNWANTKQKECQQYLPELIQRLIFASASKKDIKKIEFPSGDSVALSGWDGILTLNYESPFFPNKSSAWEIGADKSPGVKAESDYKKRTKDPLDVKPKNSTYVFVTPRSWPKRGAWIDKKKATKEWGNVRVINADNIELWLESTPAVALWLAKKINKVTGSIIDIENYWEEWSSATEPVMTKDLVVGGRFSQVKSIVDWIQGDPEILCVQGDSPDEPIGFLYSSIATLSGNDKKQALSKCVVVNDIEELRQLLKFDSHLIIATTSECIEAVGLANEKGHHVFVGMDTNTTSLKSILRLNRLSRNEVEKNLVTAGVKKKEAVKISRDVGRSISVLRRHLSKSGTKNPSWANADSAKILLPAMFAGAWSDNKDGDKKILEKLSGMEYVVYRKELKKFTLIDDSPVSCIGTVWTLKSPLDLWYLLAKFIDNDFLALFRESILSVLTKTDPKYDLPINNRWAAAMYGKESLNSEWIRRGLVESLTLLAVNSSLIEEATSPQYFADSVVEDIFGEAKKWEAWASLKDETPQLAEASPNAFLVVLEKIIEKNPKLFKKLFEGGSGLFSDCNHAGLLWAIESIAWDSEYFSRVASIIADLSLIDPGGSWSNRPINSLKDLFQPGLPQTNTRAVDRLEVLGELSKKEPVNIWSILKTYINGGSMSESHRFRWRDDGGSRQGLEPEDISEHKTFVRGLKKISIELACAKENLISSLSVFTNLPDYLKDNVIKALNSVQTTDYSKSDHVLLLSNIRDKLSWINSYGDPSIKKYIKDLENNLKRLKPTDPFDRLGWLFESPWIDLPTGNYKKYSSGKDQIVEEQKKGAREILDTVTVEKIADYSKKLTYPGVFGGALGGAVKKGKEDNSVLDLMIRKSKHKHLLIPSYVEKRIEIEGDIWVTKQIKRLKTKKDFNKKDLACLYLGMPEDLKTWKIVEKEERVIESEYWKYASGYTKIEGEKKDETEFVIRKFLKFKSAAKALRVAGSFKEKLSSLLLYKTLEAVLSLDSKKDKVENDVMNEYYIGNVFENLYKQKECSDEEIAKLEWGFAPLLKDMKRYITSTPAIYRILQKDPSLFVHMVSLLYKRDDGSKDPSQKGVDADNLRAMAHNADDLLRSWDLLPGLNEKGDSLDGVKLNEWVKQARRQSKEKKYSKGCDLQISKMLAKAPIDTDGNWPHVSCRIIIENLKSELIEKHIENAIYNNRGVVSKGLAEGGSQERVLSSKYSKYSEVLKIKWPRTSAMLKSIAKTYENEAIREDTETELHGYRWG